MEPPTKQQRVVDESAADLTASSCQPDAAAELLMSLAGPSSGYDSDPSTSRAPTEGGEEGKEAPPFQPTDAEYGSGPAWKPLSALGGHNEAEREKSLASREWAVAAREAAVAAAVATGQPIMAPAAAAPLQSIYSASNPHAAAGYAPIAAAHPGTNGMVSRTATRRQPLKRCGECAGCVRRDCDRCINCLDRPSNGGPGLRKKACELRRCLQPIPADAMAGHGGFPPPHPSTAGAMHRPWPMQAPATAAPAPTHAAAVHPGMPPMAQHVPQPYPAQHMAPMPHHMGMPYPPPMPHMPHIPQFQMIQPTVVIHSAQPPMLVQPAAPPATAFAVPPQPAAPPLATTAAGSVGVGGGAPTLAKASKKRRPGDLSWVPLPQQMPVAAAAPAPVYEAAPAAPPPASTSPPPPAATSPSAETQNVSPSGARNNSKVDLSWMTMRTL